MIRLNNRLNERISIGVKNANTNLFFVSTLAMVLIVQRLLVMGMTAVMVGSSKILIKTGMNFGNGLI